MLSAIWKVVALFGVIGIGCFVVLEVHKRLPEQTETGVSADDFQSLAGNATGQGADLVESAGTTVDPFQSTAQLEPALESTAPAASSDDAWLFGNGEPSAEIGQASPVQGAESGTDEWGAADFAPQPVRELPEEFEEGDNPFAASPDTEASPSLQPLNTASGPGLAAPPTQEEDDPFVRTAEGEATGSVDVIPASDQQFAGDAGAYDPFGGAETAPAIDDAGAAATEPPAIDLFASEPETGADFGGDTVDPFASGGGETTSQPEVVLPEEAEEAGFDPAIANPRQPAVDADPFGSSGGEPVMELDSQPASADTGFDPFGGPGGGNDSPATVSSEPLEIELGPAGGAETVLPESESSEPTFAEFPEATTEPSAEPFILDDDGPPARRAAPPVAESDALPVNEMPAIRPARPDYVGEATLDADAPAGPQQPELTVEKVAPQEATVGEPLIYAIRVKNVGNIAAHDVIVEDRIPRGTTLEGTIPQAELIEKRLVWRLGTMDPDQEKTIRIKVVPTESGEIGSVATVRFVAEVAAATRITSPSLALEMTGPTEIAVGEPATFRFTVTNTGKADAANVYVRNLLPEGLEHPGGRDIEYEVGTLAAGQSRSVELTVTGVAAGQFETKGLVSTGNTTRSEDAVAVNVIPARLLIQRQGPRRRFVGGTAEYVTHVSNRSSEALQKVTIVEQIPEGLELAGVPQDGQFDAQRRTITRRIAELAPGASTTFTTSLMARDQGTWDGIVQASDAAGNKAEVTSPLEVAGFPSLAFDVEHDGRPVAVGERVALRLVVKNRGTGAAEDVQAQFEIPDNMEFVNAEGPVEFEQDGRFVKFAALDTLEAKGEESFDIILTAAEPGTTRVSAQLTTPGLAEPLRHDEAVIVESDGR